ncbi:MAG: hypothetical protein K6F69_07200 [Treponema sp.]|nr:hypothetical protein [Treponema sp.]
MKIFIITTFILLLISFNVFSSSVSAVSKVTIGGNFYESSDWEEAEGFKNAYVTGETSIKSDNVTAQVKVTARLFDGDNGDDYASSMEVKKASLRVALPFYSKLSFIGGKLYALSLPGSYFSLGEIYSASGRWGANGLGVEYKGDFIKSAGLNFINSYVTSSSESKASKWSKGASVNGAVVFDFNKYSIPVTLGTSLLYDSTGDGEHSVNTTDDYSGSVFLQYKNRSYSLASGYSYNSTPAFAQAALANKLACYTSSSSSSRVKALDTANIFSLTFSGNTDWISCNFEGEIGKSVHGSYIPLYSAFQLLLPLTEHFALKPSVSYFAAWDYKDRKDSYYDNLVMYPRLWFTAGKHTVSAGCKISHYSMKVRDYGWGVSVPVYWSYKL